MRRSWSLVLAVLVLVTSGAGVVPAAAATSGVSGPVAGVPQTTWSGLDAFGYREDEWFLDGVAASYAPQGTWNSDGVWPAVEAGNAEFRTRMLVRRPTNPAAFNGTVVVEWLNVTAGFDVAPTWAAAIDELLRRGYAYVGVSAQAVGVNSLKNGVPGRYGTLNHPGDQFSYDMFTQAAEVVRGPQRRLLLPGLAVDKVLATGESQSASRLVTYLNAVHPLVRAYDGFLIYSRGSGASSIGGGATMPTNPIVRTDLRERVIELQTEGDLVVLRSHLARQDDHGRFRLWEVAGGSHTDEHTLSPKNPPFVSTAGSPCQYRLNSARTHFVVGAAVLALDRWTRRIAHPRRAPRIETTVDAATAADPIVRDADGNARGGIRLPQMQVPIATIDGLANPPAPGAPDLFIAFCRLFGRTQPFAEADIDARYPNHLNYALTVYWYAVIDANLGFLAPEDPIQLLWEAAISDVGADA